MVPLFSVIVVPPLAAVKVAEFPQPVRVGETGFARKTLAGSVSVREACVSVVLGRGLWMVMVNRLVAPAQMVPGLKLLLTEGVGIPVTFKVALAGLVFVMVVPPPVEFNLPASMVFIKLPETCEVTFTVTVHDPAFDPTCAGTVPPVKLIEVDVVETVPPQVLVTPGGLAI